MDDPADVIFEFVQVGRSVKVSAIDVATATEVSIVGPVGSGDATLRAAALQKLVYVLRRRSPRAGVKVS